MMHVLIVDDKPLQRILIRETLIQHPELAFDEADSAAQAMSSAQTTRPDLILLDVTLPDMNGLDLCRSLRADPALASIPIMLVTGVDNLTEKIPDLSAIVDDYVIKPFDVDDFRVRVDRLLRLKRS